MAGFLGSGGVNTSELASTYRTLVPSLALSSISDLSYSPSSATTYTFTKNFIVAKNITIGVNATVNTASGTSAQVIICDTLALNGVIQAQNASNGGIGGGGGGAGGAGTVGIIIFARQISGTGIVKANGVNGVNGVSTTPANNAGISSFKLLSTTNVTGANVASYNSSGGATSVNLGAYESFVKYPSWLQNVLNQSPFSDTSFGASSTTTVSPYLGNMNLYTSGGSGGISNNSTGNGYYAHGGAGGCCIHIPGGNAGTGVINVVGAGAGGGGAGGAVWIFSENAVPAINVQVIGGSGGNALTSGGGGGGGAGGYVCVYAPSNSLVATLTGGIAGANAGAGITPTAGSNGMSDFFYFAP